MTATFPWQLLSLRASHPPSPSVHQAIDAVRYFPCSPRARGDTHWGCTEKLSSGAQSTAAALSSWGNLPRLLLHQFLSWQGCAPTKAGCTNMQCTHRSLLSIGSVSLIIYKGFPRLCDAFGSAPPTEDTKLLGAVTAHPGFAMANRVTKRSPCCTRFPDSSHHHRERRKARVPPGRAVDVVRVV